jgi:hypothetical protein
MGDPLLLVNSGPEQRLTARRRVLVFLLVCLICLAGAVLYAVYVAWRTQAAAPDIISAPISRVGADDRQMQGDSPVSAGTRKTEVQGAARPEVPTAPSVPANPAASRQDASRRSEALQASEPKRVAGARVQILYRSTALGDTYGRVSMANVGSTDEPRYVSPIECDRVHFAAGTGLCLRAKRGVFTTFHAHVFDRDFVVRHSVPLLGVPSRARVSPDGRFAAMTVFVTGHSYAGSDFSTRTSILDARTGQFIIEDLETLTVYRDGVPFKSEDFNFWGVTFVRDSSRFFVTLGTKDQHYLLEGDSQARTASVVTTRAECPSLSPAGSHVAFKRRATQTDGTSRFTWRVYVLDLSTGKETELGGETRNVDDQVEWLDDQTILYSLPEQASGPTASTNTWAISTQAGAAPQLLLPYAFSPAVVR